MSGRAKPASMSGKAKPLEADDQWMSTRTQVGTAALGAGVAVAKSEGLAPMANAFACGVQAAGNVIVPAARVAGNAVVSGAQAAGKAIVPVAVAASDAVVAGAQAALPYAAAVVTSPVFLVGVALTAAALLGAMAMHFYLKPARPVAVPRAPPGKSAAQLLREAHAALGIDPNNHYNIAVCGQTGTGKSSLINALRGLRDTDVGAARVDITECTMKAARYDHPDIPHLKLWDIPGAGTKTHPAATYFDDQRLYAFDIILVVSAERFTEVSQQIAAGAAKYNRRIGFVWSKADRSFDDIRRSHRGISDAEVRQLLRQKVNASFVANGLAANHELFLVSAADFSSGEVNYDEANLVNFFKAAAQQRQ
eukprot:m.448987 g.448987  ORF g.448987 m.448987 type:complete len:365 (+) comp56895_c0_seq2:285-1379(+)